MKCKNDHVRKVLWLKPLFCGSFLFVGSSPQDATLGTLSEQRSLSQKVMCTLVKTMGSGGIKQQTATTETWVQALPI